ncbi:MAG: HEPN domain-containing protein [Cyanobacteria bacterium J06560_6]
MSDLEKAKILLQVAKRDLSTISGMLDSETFSDEPFGFFVQQAAEKLLKAWLSAIGETYPYTHNLTSLLQSLEDLDCDVKDYWELADFIPFAVQFRYELLLSEDEPIARKATLIKIRML